MAGVQGGVELPSRLTSGTFPLDPAQFRQIRVRLSVPITLRFGTSSVVASAMIDTGSDFDLIDSRFVRDHQVPVQSCPEIHVRAFDGGVPSSGPLREESRALTVDFRGHLSHTQFHVSTVKGFDVILGLPWLYLVRPVIDFRTATIQPADTLPALPRPPSVRLIDEQELAGEEQVFALYVRSLLTAADGRSAPDASSPESSIPAAYADFADLFSRERAAALPRHTKYDHRITLEPGKEPPFGPLYGMNPTELVALKDYLETNLAQGFIQPSTSPAGAPILFVKKKDGSLRLCADYRGLNAVTVKDRTALPLISETLSNLRGAKVFTAIDLRGAYNLIRVAEGDEWKTAFRTRYGHFEYLVMPFGLTNAPATFQRMINEVLRPYLDVFCAVYLDDILIYSASEAEHVQHVRTILTALRDHDLYVKAEKCHWHVDSTAFLGFVVTPEGVRMADDKVQAIREWPAPRTLSQLQSFLGFAGYYRELVPDYARVAKPLTRLTRQGAWAWSDEALKAFEQLKMAVTEAPVLRTFDTDLPAVVETDSSGEAISGILSQYHDGRLHPCAYFSRQMEDAETRYDIHDKELLAIMECLKAWRIYLEGRPQETTVRTDHLNLRYFMTKRPLTARQARWAEILSRYNVFIEYRSGSTNVRADAMSRRADYMTRDLDEHAPFFGPDQHNFPVVGALTADDGRPRPTPDEIRALIGKYHDSPLAGHGGTRRTLSLLRRAHNWPGMRRDVQEYVKLCGTCAQTKHSTARPYGLLQPLPVPELPWQSVTMDYIVKLPESSGHDSIAVFVDRLTKCAHFRATREDIDAAAATDLFLDSVVRLHGVPDEVITDRGVHFKSEHWKRFHEATGCRVKLSTAYHPQTDGQTERANQTLETYLRAYVSANQADWAGLLPCAEFAYNNAPNASTCESPFMLNYGFHPRSSDDPTPLQRFETNALVREARRVLETSREKMRQFADRKRRPSPFHEGDWVMLSTRNLGIVQPSAKLGPRFVGPYQITQDFGNGSYRLATPNLRKHPVYHASLLKAADSRSRPLHPGPITVDNEEEWEVEAILKKRAHKDASRDKFRVRWKGFGPDFDEWVPRSGLENAQELLAAFESKLTAAPAATTRRRRRRVQSKPEDAAPAASSASL